MNTFREIGAQHITQDNLNVLWLLQFIGVTMPLLISPIIFSNWIVKDPEHYLKTNFKFPWLLIVVVFVTMMLSNPLIEFLGNLNAKMVLPKFLSGLEKWMRDSEDSAKKISDNMMQMKTIWNMLFDLIFIGLLTALVEEIMFRGCLQTILLQWTKNNHAAVWITAILFSTFHLEFFGFLPRMFLGVLFGYFTIWSGSVWPSIWAHFINNGSVVVLTYMAQQKLININVDDEHMFNNPIYIASLLITVALLYFYHYIAVKRQISDHGEELGQNF